MTEAYNDRPEDQKFHVQINGGPVHVLNNITTGKYILAAMAALAMIPYEEDDDYDVVKIWVPNLMEPDSSGSVYGPYFYAFDGHNVGNPTKDRQF